MAKETFYRQFPRRQFRSPVGVLCLGQFIMTKGLEIGEGGLLFESSEKFQTGTDIVVNFFVPGRDFVSVKGQLIYALPPKGDETSPSSQTAAGYGVKFYGIAFEFKRMIRDYIAEKTALEDNAA